MSIGKPPHHDSFVFQRRGGGNCAGGVHRLNGRAGERHHRAAEKQKKWRRGKPDRGEQLEMKCQSVIRGFREDPEMNSIRWGVTGERARYTRSLEPKSPGSAKETVCTKDRGQSQRIGMKRNGDERKSRTRTSHDWRQNGRNRCCDKQ